MHISVIRGAVKSTRNNSGNTPILDIKLTCFQPYCRHTFQHIQRDQSRSWKNKNGDRKEKQVR